MLQGPDPPWAALIRVASRPGRTQRQTRQTRSVLARTGPDSAVLLLRAASPGKQGTAGAASASGERLTAGHSRQAVSAEACRDARTSTPWSQCAGRLCPQGGAGRAPRSPGAHLLPFSVTSVK